MKNFKIFSECPRTLLNSEFLKKIKVSKNNFFFSNSKIK